MSGTATDLHRRIAESAKTAMLSRTHAPIGKGGTNWITKLKPGNTGQLPAYIQNVRNAIMRDGTDESRATAIAIGRVRDWADGKGNVGPEVRAAAAKAIAEWERDKAQNKIKEAVLAVLEAGDAEDKKDGGADESTEQPAVYCVKDAKKVTPTAKGKCPNCGLDLSKAIANAKKVQEAVIEAVAATAPTMSSVPRRPGESLTSWGKRLKAGDAALAASQKKTSTTPARTRSGGSATAFNQAHPRGRGGQWIFKSGSSGAEVKGIQSKLGSPVNGQYGAATKQAVEAFQRKNGLVVDGVVGAQTVAAMRGDQRAAQVKVGAMSTADRQWLAGLVKRSRP